MKKRTVIYGMGALLLITVLFAVFSRTSDKKRLQKG